MSTPPLPKIALETTDPLALAGLLLPIQPDDHVEGAENARLTLVEYGDYECPACGTLFQTIRQLQERMSQDIRMVYRHYPFSGKHPHAQMAAEAAEAAGAQNRFWEMHELLFQHQDALAEKNLRQYAAKLGLDEARFKRELKDRTYEDRVREDFKRGVANGVYGTPGLFVNGVRYNGALDAESFAAKISSLSPGG